MAVVGVGVDESFRSRRGHGLDAAAIPAELVTSTVAVRGDAA